MSDNISYWDEENDEEDEENIRTDLDTYFNEMIFPRNKNGIVSNNIVYHLENENTGQLYPGKFKPFDLVSRKSDELRSFYQRVIDEIKSAITQLDYTKDIINIVKPDRVLIHRENNGKLLFWNINHDLIFELDSTVRGFGFSDDGDYLYYFSDDWFLVELAYGDFSNVYTLNIGGIKAVRICDGTIYLITKIANKASLQILNLKMRNINPIILTLDLYIKDDDNVEIQVFPALSRLALTINPNLHENDINQKLMLWLFDLNDGKLIDSKVIDHDTLSISKNGYSTTLYKAGLKHLILINQSRGKRYRITNGLEETASYQGRDTNRTDMLVDRDGKFYQFTFDDDVDYISHVDEDYYPELNNHEGHLLIGDYANSLAFNPVYTGDKPLIFDQGIVAYHCERYNDFFNLYRRLEAFRSDDEKRQIVENPNILEATITGYFDDNFINRYRNPNSSREMSEIRGDLVKLMIKMISREITDRFDVDMDLKNIFGIPTI